MELVRVVRRHFSTAPEAIGGAAGPVRALLARERWEPLLTLVLVLALLATGLSGTAAADTHDIPGVVTVEHMIPFHSPGWVVDRADVDVWDGDGPQLIVDVTDTTTQQYTGSPDPSCFRCTEGRKHPLGAGVTRAEATLTVDTDWDGSVPVRAGLWTHGGPSSSSYGIIEFVTGSDLGALGNNTTQTGIRFWDTIAGAWDFADVDVSGGGSITLGVELNTDAGRYEYLVDGAIVGTGPVENTEEELVEVFLNHYNYGSDSEPRDPAVGYDPVPYTVQWFNLRVSGSFDTIQAAVDAADPGASISVGPGTYTGPVTVDKPVEIIGSGSESILEVPANADGFTVTSDDVVIDNMTIVGPHADDFTSHNWTDPNVATTTGIRVSQNLGNIGLFGNDISDVRSGILLLANADAVVLDNVIDNTKGSILLRGDGVDMENNAPGPTGNEWDIVLLDHVTETAYFGSPAGDLAGYGSNMMALSALNGGMTILDRRFGSNGLLADEDVGNRSHIVVDPAAPALTAADDFDFGNGLGNPRQPLGNLTDGVDAVVHGGVVTVRAGDYVGDVTIGTPAQFQLEGDAQIAGGVRITAPGTVFSGFDITNPSGGYGVRVDVGDVTVSDNTITDIGTAESFTNSASGIYIAPSGNIADVTVSGNDISNVGRANTWSHKGIFLGDANSDAVISGVVIDDNTIAGVSAPDKGGYGITTNVGSSGSGSAPGLQVTNNTISNLSGRWARAIALEGPTLDAVVTGNTASGLTATEFDASGVFFEANPAADSTLIQHNRFSDMAFGVALHPSLAAAVDARNNWWGTADGPGVGPGLVGAFPGGGSIDSDLWCLQEACSSFAELQDITVGPAGQYGTIQDAIDAAAPERTIRVAAGNYGPITVNKTLAIVGEPGATIDVAVGETGITVLSDGVVIEGLTVDGAQDVAHYDNLWTESSTGISVGGNLTEVLLRDNTVGDVRTGIYVHPNAAVEAVGNTIENTKGSFILYSDLVTMDDNQTGPLGNEWDIVVLLNSNEGAYFGDPQAGEAAYGAAVMDLSAANNGMTVLDRRFGSIGFIAGYEDIGNRSHVLVDATADFDASDDFDLGNGLGNPRQPLNNITDAVEAAVLGGVVTVADGAYVGDVTIAEPVTLQAVGTPSIEGKVGITAAGTDFSGFEVTNPNGGIGVQIEAADVTVSDNHIHHIGTGATGLAQAIYVNASAADTDDIEISDNIITDVGNLATGRSHKAILVGDSTSDNVISGLRITGNDITGVVANRLPWAPGGLGGAGAYGIQINVGFNGDGSTEGAVIADNTISDLSGHWVHAIGLEGPTPNALVSGNDIADLDASKNSITDAFDDEVGVFFEGNDGAVSTLVTQNAFSGMTYGVATHPDADVAAGSIDARRNYWGVGGPTSMRLGTGDDLTEAFVFSPWLDAPGGSEVFPSGVVSGQIVDGTGAGVPDVTVTVSGTGGQPDVTGTDGRYSVSREPGTYTVTVTLPGGAIASGPTQRTVIVASGGSATANFVVVTTGTIAGRVLDVVGSPVSGVTVTLGGGPSTTTGTDGGYQFAGRPSGSDTVTVTLPGGYTAGGPTSRTVNLASGSSATADFLIARTAAISGRVVDAAGVGRSGVAVSLSGAGSATTTTGADGSYVFADRAQFGAYTVAITLPADFVAGGPTSRSINLASGSSATADFAIARRASISGQVVDSTGAGVAGIPVAVTRTGGTPNNVTTDALGRYRVEGLSQFGAYSVTMSVPSGFVANGPTNRAVNLASGSSATADFAVVEVASISGQVVDEVGAPVSGITVTLSGAGGGTTLTDTAGRYRFTDRTQFGAYAVTIAVPSGFTPGSPTSRTVNLAAGASASADFRILQQATVSGQVLDGTGAPISGVAVDISGPDGARDPRVTDAQGRYRLTGQTAFGAYTVRITPPSGFVAGGATTRTVNLAGGSSATADFRVVATATVAGQVTDATGAGLSGVTVTITPPTGAPITQTTDGQGRYRATGLSTFGAYQVSIAVPAGFAAAGVTTRTVNLADGSSAAADFSLAQTASIAGRVLDAAGAPVAAVTVTLSGAGTGSTQTDAAGNYRFANRSQFGRYTVSVTVPTGFTANGPTSRIVNLASGQAAAASFALTETGTISGQIVDNTLSGISGVTVSLPGQPDVLTDAEGRYRFAGLPVGTTHTVTVTVPDGYEAEGDTAITTPVGGVVDVTLLPLGTVSGYLFIDLDGDGVRGSGEPALAGITVNLIVGGGTVDTTVSAADGFYLFEGTPADASIEVVAAGYESLSSTAGAASFQAFGAFAADFSLAADATSTFREDVGLLPAGTIVGAVRTSSGDPVAGVPVTLGGNAAGSSVTSSDGVFVFIGLGNNTADSLYTLSIAAPSGFTLQGAGTRAVSLVSVGASVQTFTLALTTAGTPDDDDDDGVDPDEQDPDETEELASQRPTLTTTPGAARATWQDANGTTRLELDLSGAKSRSGSSEPVFDAVRIGNPASPSTAVAALGREGIRSAGIAAATEAVRLTITGVDFEGGTICPAGLASGQRIIAFDGANLLGRDITTTVDGRTCALLQPNEDGDVVIDLLVVDLGEPTFGDVGQTSPHFLAVEALAADSREILRGGGDGDFDAGGLLRRDQAASILARALGLDLGDADGGFSDVTSDMTHAAAIAALMELDPPVITGFTDGTFRPGAFITRDQLASIVVRAYRDQLEGPSGSGFPDVADDSVHADNIDRLINSGAIQGFTDGTFGSGSNISRAQVASVVARSLYRTTAG